MNKYIIKHTVVREIEVKADTIKEAFLTADHHIIQKEDWPIKEEYQQIQEKK